MTLLVGATSSMAQQPCSDASTEQWVRETHEYIMSVDHLGSYAIEHFGTPSTCEGAVTTEYDGMKFGVISLGFVGGAQFSIETMPPEASIATLTDSSGLGDESELLKVLKRYADNIGVDIDWSKPIVREAADERVETYWDPEDGLNASARFIFVDDRLISVSVSLAL